MLPFETERLFFREFTELDVHLFVDLNSNPEVVKYTGDVALNNEEEAMVILCYVLNQYQENGYGRLAVFEKESKEFIGYCGLKFHPEEGETDIGYRLKKKFWGKGYATEASRACLKMGFNTFNLERIVAHAMSENIDSIRVLEKLGMKFSKEIELHDSPAKLFVLERADWNAKD